MCGLIFGGIGIVLHAPFGTITRLNAEATAVAFSLFGLFAGLYTGWRNAYKLWRVDELDSQEGINNVGGWSHHLQDLPQ
jgi:hypothetical protein